MNDTTSPKHPPLSHDQAPPGASHAQCGGGHAECFERLRDSIVSWFIDNFGTGNVTVIPPGARLLVHLPPDAMDRPLLWSKVLGDVADLLDVRVAGTSPLSARGDSREQDLATVSQRSGAYRGRGWQSAALWATKDRGVCPHIFSGSVE